jgi:uncharacterized DUF497 family protein
MKFEWNTEKEKINIKKRGITFEQASYVFSDPFALSKYDDDHSEDEDRKATTKEKQAYYKRCPK